MPELPEVHTIATDLRNNIIDYKIIKAFVSEKYPKIENKAEFKIKIENKSIKDVFRVAKNILIKLDDDTYLHFHLAMTGQIFLLELDQIKGKKAHVVLQIQKNGQNKALTFSDTRMFGKAEVINNAALEALIARYGDEPIDKNFDIKSLYDKLKKRKTIIKNILMDQSLIAGLGNIYATEALFLANILPTRKTNTLTEEEFSRLMDAACNVLNQGIKNRGSTLPDKMYVDIWGKTGSQQEHFNIYLKNYCPQCNSKTAFEKINGRGTYYCKNCQR